MIQLQSVLLCLLALTGPALAQVFPGFPELGGNPDDQADAPNGATPTKDTAPAPPPRDHIDVALSGQLLTQARQALRELERIESRTQPNERWNQIGRDLPAQARELAALEEQARQRIREAARWVDVADIEYVFRQRLVELEPLLAHSARQLRRTNEAQERINALLAAWKQAAQDLSARAPSADVSRRVHEVIEEATQVQLRLRRAESEALQVQVQVGDAVEDIEDLLQFAAEEGPSLRRDLLRRGPAPWQAFESFASPQELGASVARRIAHHRELLRSFALASLPNLLANALLVLAAFVVCLWLRFHVKQSPERNRPDLTAIVRYPGAATVLLGAVATVVLYPAEPGAFSVMAYLVGSLAVLRLAPVLFPWIGRVELGAMYTLLLVDSARMLLTEPDGVDTLTLLVEGLATAAYLVHLVRSPPSNGPRGVWRGIRGAALRIWLFAMTLGVVATVSGFAQTGALLISATVLVIFITFIWGAAYQLTIGTVRSAVQSRLAQRLNGLAHHGELVIGRLALALQVVIGFMWFRSVLRQYTLWDEAAETSVRLLEFKVEVGSLQLSVFDVVMLALGLFMAVLAARMIRFVLDEDILPRTSLGIGSRVAFSTCIFYGVLFFGLFAALAAAGFDLGKLTFLMGAIGIGVGFGLQNIIQNFVSGLILIFGRPIHIGDTIQLGELIGKVHSIGFRASVVRSFQGAEVVVPNAELISNQVINWTLSDQQRRIELDVGVAYGTDPDQVIDLLLGEARAHPDILEDPQPEALFLEHGSSSLNFQLRAWTGTAGRWPNIKSDLTIGVNKALRAANIEIPFPQRDLHLRTVDGKVLEGLK